MRILMDYRPALVERTGVGEYAHQLAAALVPQLAASETLTLFSSSWKDRLAGSPVPGAQVVDARIPVRVLNAAWHRVEAPPAEWLAGPIDVAHSMHPLLMPSRRAAQVVTIYDLFYLDDATGTAAEIRRDYVPLTASHAARADAVVVISDYTAAQVRTRLGVPAERILLCPPGAPAWTARSRPPSSTPGPILFVGSPELRKNLPRLLRAHAALRARRPDAPGLVIAGRPPLTGSELAAMLASEPYARYVSHRGYVDEAHRYDLYRQASMLVLPSLDEGFGIPALEAMTAGVPVVASDRGALPEVIGDAGLLVPAEDEGALSAAMERMLTDASFAAAAVERGLARARRFSWTDSAARLLEGYREAFARKRATRG